MRTRHGLVFLAALIPACSGSVDPVATEPSTPPSSAAGPSSDAGAAATDAGGGGPSQPPATDPGAPSSATSPLRHRLVVDDATVTFMRADGAVFRWGQFASANGSTRPVQLGLTDSRGVAVGDSQTVCSLRADGGVQCSSWMSPTVTDIDGVTDAVGLTATGRTFCAHRKDKTVTCFQGDGFSAAVPVTALGAVDSFDVLGDASIELSGNFKLCGLAANGISCVVHPNDAAATPIPSTAGARQVLLADGGTVLFLDANGRVMSYEDGTNYAHPVGMSSVTAFAGVAAARIERWGDCVITTKGAPHCKQDVPTSVADVVEIGLGYEFGCALTKNEKVLCWGKNELGQLGVGTTYDSTDPVEALVP